MSTGHGWIGVDLDGTLAWYDGWRGEDHIGEPIKVMVERVKRWLAEGIDVRIFTARVGPGNDPAANRERIWQWCDRHGIPRVPITAEKDFLMMELWDDRCVQLITNTGVPVDGRR